MMPSFLKKSHYTMFQNEIFCDTLYTILLFKMVRSFVFIWEVCIGIGKILLDKTSYFPNNN